MILDAIMGVICAIPNALLDGIDVIDVSVPANAFDYLSQIISFLGWLLPIAALIPLFILECAVMAFRVIWALVIRIKSFIPTMGA